MIYRIRSLDKYKYVWGTTFARKFDDFCDYNKKFATIDINIAYQCRELMRNTLLIENPEEPELEVFALEI